MYTIIRTKIASAREIRTDVMSVVPYCGVKGGAKYAKIDGALP